MERRRHRVSKRTARSRSTSRSNRSPSPVSGGDKTSELARTASTDTYSLLLAFQLFDADGSGHIDVDEMKNALMQLGRDPDDAEEMIAHADQDNDGHIDFDEFKRINSAAVAPGWGGVLQQATAFSTPMQQAQALAASLEVAMQPLQKAIRSGAASTGLAPVTVVSEQPQRRVRSAGCCVRICAGATEAFVGVVMTLAIVVVLLLFAHLFLDGYRMGKDWICAERGHNQLIDAFAAKLMGTTDAALSTWCDPNEGCPDLYDLLELDRNTNFTPKELKKKYRSASMKWCNVIGFTNLRLPASCAEVSSCYPVARADMCVSMSCVLACTGILTNQTGTMICSCAWSKRTRRSVIQPPDGITISTEIWTKQRCSS